MDQIIHWAEVSHYVPSVRILSIIVPRDSPDCILITAQNHLPLPVFFFSEMGRVACNLSCCCYCCSSRTPIPGFEYFYLFFVDFPLDGYNFFPRRTTEIWVILETPLDYWSITSLRTVVQGARDPSHLAQMSQPSSSRLSL